MLLFHRHEWDLVQETVNPSPHEQAASAGDIFSGHCPSWVFTRTVLWLLKCSRCGKTKIKKFKMTV